MFLAPSRDSVGLYLQRFELLGVMSLKLVTISWLYVIIVKSSWKLKLREVMKDIGRAANLGYHLSDNKLRNALM